MAYFGLGLGFGLAIALAIVPRSANSQPTDIMGLVKKLVLGGTVYGVAREFNKKRDGEPQSRQAAPDYYPQQHSQQHYCYHPQQQPSYYAPPQQHHHQEPPAYEQHQPAPSNYQPQQAWDEKR